MVRVMFPPLATLVAGVNTRTGATALPETSVDRVMDAKFVILDMIAAASLPAVRAASALDDILKPAVVAAWAAPRVSPVSVMVIAAAPVALPPVVSTMVVLVEFALPEVAVNLPTSLAMELTVPKK